MAIRIFLVDSVWSVGCDWVSMYIAIQYYEGMISLSPFKTTRLHLHSFPIQQHLYFDGVRRAFAELVKKVFIVTTVFMVWRLFVILDAVNLSAFVLAHLILLFLWLHLWEFRVAHRRDISHHATGSKHHAEVFLSVCPGTCSRPPCGWYGCNDSNVASHYTLVGGHSVSW